jgi:hypothetical protein
VQAPLAIPAGDVDPEDNGLGLPAPGWAIDVFLAGALLGPLGAMLSPVALFENGRFHGGAATAAFTIGFASVVISSFLSFGGLLGWLLLLRETRRFVAGVSRARLADQPDGAFVFVEGRVAPDASCIASPLTGEPCVLGVLRIEHKHFNARQRTVATKETSVPFDLEAEGDLVHVAPEGALLRGTSEEIDRSKHPKIEGLRRALAGRRWLVVGSIATAALAAGYGLMALGVSLAATP